MTGATRKSKGKKEAESSGFEDEYYVDFYHELNRSRTSFLQGVPEYMKLGRLYTLYMRQY